MMDRLEDAGERVRRFLDRHRLKISAVLGALVVFGVITPQVAGKLEIILDTVTVMHAEVAALQTQVGGVGDVAARAATAVTVAGAVDRSSRVIELERQLAEIEQTAAQICGPEVGAADCLVSREQDRREAWAGRDRDIDEAVNEVSNELAAAQATIRELEAQNADRVCFAREEWNAAQRGDLGVLCANR